MFSKGENIANPAEDTFSSERQGEEKSRGEEYSTMDSGDIAIHVRNLSKCYQIYDTPRDRLRQFIAPRVQRLAGQAPKQYFREFWALKDVSFEVRRGETVGIIGRNGSGKSTLLQIICGTLAPTAGSVETRGRIAALLELGSGFNPEFTGRENVYMNATVLGLTKEEIEARYSDIQAFADIGDFIDQPVKSYSSGMVVRLAFAVAINVAPDILVVDEALSVGDELFQRKCFSRIEAIKKSGATILFVSHSGATIVELCARAVLLDRGEMLSSGQPKAIIAKYQKLLYAPESKREQIRKEIKANSNQNQSTQTRALDQQLATPSGTVEFDTTEEFFDPNLKPQSTVIYEPRGAVIQSPQIFSLTGEPLNCLKRGKVYCFKYDVHFTESVPNVRFGMLIKTTSGVELGGGASAPAFDESLVYAEANSVYQVEFRFHCFLNPGAYYLNAGVMGIQANEETFLHRLLDIIVFRVLPDSRNVATGIVDFGCKSDFKKAHLHS
ncbi:ABC transporter ATP-binding protein [Nitrosospira multiformis]|uniref:ABC transporter ATP-binding protein n=1 Tax=Nitrosospira multiformis TaxID=1231 RepID=UPI000898EF48|nr:ABC transporter ATP-binding protein [Nitrosospira multiformis]SEA43459.1 lipopolysaccharide transport system ATP-binding protein [Nitrosospira multiformis]